METQNRSLSIFLLLLLSLIWGTSFILMKRGLEALSWDEVAALRVTVAGILALPIAFMKRHEIKSHYLGKLLISGMLGVFIPAFLFTAAQQYINSSLAGILNSLAPLWTFLMGVLFFGQTFRRAAVVGLLIGLAGTIVLMLSRSGGSITGFNVYGLLVIAATAFYGTNLNFVKFKITGLGSLAITGGSIAMLGPIGAIILFGFTDYLHTLQNVPGAWTASAYVALLAFMSTAVAGFLFNKLVRITNPLFTSMVTYLIPLVSVMWGVLDKEQVFLSHFVGMAAILFGVYWANRK